MPQTDNARLPSSKATYPEYRENLRIWLTQSSSGSFTASELELHRSVALAYADPRRPSIRQLHTMLCEMLDRDSLHSGASLVHPTLAEFRALVLKLPAKFIDDMRYAPTWDIWDILGPAANAADTKSYPC